MAKPNPRALAIDDHMKQRLAERDRQGTRRVLACREGLVDFCSNDYLGLAQSPALSAMVGRRLHDWGATANGAAGSRLLRGNDAHAMAVERQLAGIFQTEAALLFNSGYAANLGVLSALPQRGDTIIYDELSHACLKDGARLGMAKRFAFKHNDMDDLRKKLARATGQPYIVAESVYSMDGDEAPLGELAALASASGAAIVLDEAHSTGVSGPGGGGMALAQLVDTRPIVARVHTFGKAMGVHGACVAASQTVVDYLVNFARPFIYTTAMPPHSVAAVACAFDYLGANPWLQEEAKAKIAYFIAQYEAKIAVKGVFKRIPSQSMVQALLVSGPRRAKAAAAAAQQGGYDVRAILPPTVNAGKERLRVCLHTYNSNAEIEGLANLLATLAL